MADAGAGKIYDIDIFNFLNDGHQVIFPGQPQSVLNSYWINYHDRMFKTFFPMPGRSEDYAKVFNFPIDGIYIDGGHSYLDVITDIDCWLPKISKPGLIAFHDANWPEVAKAINERFPNAYKSGCKEGEWHGVAWAWLN
jgi:hypothetical protein